MTEKIFENEKVRVICEDTRGYSTLSSSKLKKAMTDKYQDEKPTIAIRVEDPLGRIDSVDSTLDELCKSSDFDVCIGTDMPKFSYSEYARLVEPSYWNPRCVEALYACFPENFVDSMNHLSPSIDCLQTPRGVVKLRYSGASTHSPASENPNHYAQFQAISLFLGTQLKEGLVSRRPEFEKIMSQLYKCRDFDEASNIVHFDRFKNGFALVGLVDLGQIQERIRRFDEDFYPVEWKKAMQEITLTREWLQSLKTEGATFGGSK